jgi:preprotein translocase subunit SecA
VIKKVFEKIFGTANDKELKKYKKIVETINSFEPTVQDFSDEQLKDRFKEIQSEVIENVKTLDDVLTEVFAIVRESSIRTLKMRHHDVQLIGGLVLHDGRISEMKTGEGKTLVATLAVCLNAITKKGVHVVTVNDYLASRDANEMRPLYEFLGFSVGALTNDLDDDEKRKEAYNCDITYATNNELGFDYLRDNMKYDLNDVIQKDHNFVIVDEVDSILIDEARTPLIISGPTNHKMEHYESANEVALKLEIEKDFTVDEENRVILLTEDGVSSAEEHFGIDNMYDIEHAKLAHHLDQALKANYLFVKDKDYVVQNGEVIIVDEFTGRLSEGRRFSEGLHQAIEAKEKVQIQEESQTLADITFQNYFRMYKKIAGMTGTAQTEATEFAQIYGLEVISIPTNVPVAREDLNDLIYKTELEKFQAVIKKVIEINKTGRPILIGTASIEKSELLHSVLKKEKIAHTVLNAKQHEKEAMIIQNAGKKGAVTIATNMAGRGVDIKLTDDIKALGGLCIIGTERHESRRIDNQLRGRAGRQGDAGSSQFYLSLEDNLLRIFGGDKIKAIMERFGIDEGESIESGMVTRAVENAQKKVENMHFESRKHLLEYDDVANEQRKVIYAFRKNLLDENYDSGSKISENRLELVTDLLARCEIFEGGVREDFNLTKVEEVFKEELNHEINSLENLEYDELFEKLEKSLKEEYDNKMSVVDEKQRCEIERVIYLQVLDNAWREHLYQMDIMKTGINLRGYNQKDPLVEYKKESFNLFQELITRIKFESYTTLHMIQLRAENDEDIEMARRELEKLANETNENIEMIHQNLNEEEKQQKRPIEKKIPRNAECPCGSGKKYKQCCGQSGPKKGILAQ